MKEWIREAGITKNITFHSYRRTFATLQAAAGTDIRTIQCISANSSFIMICFNINILILFVVWFVLIPKVA